MSAPTLLSELRRRDIQLQAVGHELRLSAPAGALTPELREQLRRHKSDLLALLGSVQDLAGQQRAVVPLQPGGSRTPIFGVPGHNGDVFCYRALAACLGAEQPFFGLQPPGLDGAAEPLARVEALAAYFAGQIRAFRPGGPYIIAGFCAGGTIAFELAQQLLRSGAEVRFLALFGSPYPEYFRRRLQLRQRATQELARVFRHARELLVRPWSERRRYLAAELRTYRLRRDERRAAARDPVLVRRARVERACLAAVSRYRPRPYRGELRVFLAGEAWQRSGVGATRWQNLARRTQLIAGPADSTGADMLREAHAPAFAELARRCFEGVK